MFARALTGVVLVTVFQSVLAATAPVDATPGSFSVDANGGANYSIPIAIPPGTGGMVPSVALAYSKSVDNQLVGVGFSISGLSIIHRCGRTIALDGQKGGVNHDNNDRFCLDGQRLIAISGVYGGNGTEYRTERETFSKVFSYRDSAFAGEGPQYFRVTTKDGVAMEYGVSADSRIEAAPKNGVTQTTVRLWALNKVQDVKGNYHTVTYNENNVSGEYIPSRIDYTGNSNTGLQPYNSIRFTYGPRTDAIAHYEAGSAIRITQRLTRIESYADNEIVRTYNLTYDNNGAASVSRLRSLQECGSDGVCLPSTTFDYQAGSAGFNTDPDVGSYTSAMTWQPGGNHWGDVNGDGKADFVYLQGSTSTWRVLLSNGISLGTDTAWGTNTHGLKWDTADFPRLMDVNADGKADLVYYEAGTGANWRVLLSTGASFATDMLWAVTTQGISSFGGNHQFFFVDIDGDAKTDIVYLESGTATWRAALSSQGSGNTLGPDTAIGTQSYGTVSAGGYHAHYWADVNGDGKTDLVYQQDGTSAWRVMLSNGTSLGTDTVWGSNTQGIKWDTGDGPRLVDVNADGKTDLVYYQAGTGATWRVLVSTGASFASDSLWATTTHGISSYGGPHQFFLIDVDGDTKTDIVYLQQSTATWRAALSSQGNGTTLGPDTVFGAQSYGTVSAGGYHAHYWADINGDGKGDLVYLRDGTTIFKAGLSPSFVPDLLATLTNGLGVQMDLTYKSLADDSVYTKDADATYPYRDFQGSVHVVSRVTQSDGLGGQYGVSYQYGGAKLHLTGPNWLGFRWTRITDERSGVMSYSERDQNYEIGTHGLQTLERAEVFGKILRSTESFWSVATNADPNVDNPNVRFAQFNGMLEVTYELNFPVGSSPVTCVSIDNTTFGSYGTVTQSVITTDTTCSFTNPFTKTIVNTYDNTKPKRGLLTSSQVTSHAPGQPDKTRTATFTYDADGVTASETIEPDSALTLTTTYTRDAYGNRLNSSVTGHNVTTPRTTSSLYDARGQFATAVTNALGHTTTYTYDPKWGTVLTQTDPNLIAFSYAYDGFGRKERETRPDNTITTITYAACAGNCPALARYTVTTQSTGSAPAVSYIDAIGRTLRTQTTGLTGNLIYRDTEYDNQGRAARSSMPYFAGNQAHWNVSTYDALGRITVLTEADGGLTTTTYQGLTTTVEQSGPGITARSRTTTKNALGHAISVIDSLYPAQSTRYEYDALDNLIRITDPANNVTTMVYDLRGRKTSMSDPDMGTWTYDYNVFNELTSQCDARCRTQGQPQTVTYDRGGRMLTRAMVEGTTTWTYDTATKGIGKLATVSAPGGYQESHSYDSLSRPSATTMVVDGESYTTSMTYNVTGRLDTTTYPSTGFAVRRVYNSHGHLLEIRNQQTSALYWRANQDDALGHITNESFGNGLSTAANYDQVSGMLNSLLTSAGTGAVQHESFAFDVLGNLTSRTDNLQTLAETFQYDTLNRLIAVSGPAPKTFQYDVIGNLTNKSDVGSYAYNPSGTNSIRPHALISTTGALNATYTYDINGNMLSGAGRTLTWTSFNKPSQINQGITTTTFAYDANYNRIKKSTPTSTTVYMGIHYQRTTTGGLTEHKHFINAGHAIAVYTQRTTGTNDTRYLHTDHLGSIDTITDEAGVVVQRLSYDAWGKRRNTNWTDATSPIDAQTGLGYTKHEMDDEVGLINMRAREYDPVLGRFISADTTIDSMVGQGLNRYTYVNNNPLSFTDPTGHKKQVLRGVVKVVVGAILVYFSGGNPYIGSAGVGLIVSGVHDLNGCKCGTEVQPVTLAEYNYGGSGQRGGWNFSGTGSGSNSNDNGSAGQNYVSHNDDPAFSASPAESYLYSTVTVRYRRLDSVLGYEYTHAYVVVIGPKGEEFYMAAFTNGSPKNPMTALLRDMSSDGSNNGSKEWGKMYTVVKYHYDSTVGPDYQAVPYASKMVLRTTTPFSVLTDRLLDYAAHIDGLRLDYHPLSVNSNAFAHQSMTALGIDRPKPSVNAPGWDTVLP